MNEPLCMRNTDIMGWYIFPPYHQVLKLFLVERNVCAQAYVDLSLGKLKLYNSIVVLQVVLHCYPKNNILANFL